MQEPKALLRTRGPLPGKRVFELVISLTGVYAEHLAEAHYVNGRYRDSLDLCMSLLPEPYDTNVNREVIDISLRCCLRLEDRAVGERLARGCRSMVCPHLRLVLISLTDAARLVVALFSVSGHVVGSGSGHVRRLQRHDPHHSPELVAI